MAEGIKPIRRVVTGNDARGRSKVLYDSAAPRVNANTFKKGTGMTDIWMFETCPAPISGERDDGDLPFHFEPPVNGGRLRIVESACNGAPTTPGAIDLTGRASWHSRRTTRRSRSKDQWNRR